MRRSTLAFFLCSSLWLGFVTGCGDATESEEVAVAERAAPEVLERIKKRDTLRALTTYSATSYFLYRGAPMGFEYDLLERFADFLDVELAITVTDNIDSMLHQLNTGKIDLVAHGLTVTSERKKRAQFTEYLYLTHQVLVQKKPDNWRRMSWNAIDKHLIHDAIELIGDTVSVRRNSSYFDRLKHLSEEIGGDIVIDTLPGSFSTDEIIKMVVDGTVKYTVADNNIAAINASYYPVLDISVPISFSQRIAWAVRPGADSLLMEANRWIRRMKTTTDYYVIYNKYFKNERNFRRRVRSEFFSLNENRISPFDDIIREQAAQIGWDWRLLASLIYQESKFVPEAQSWAEARGLMQIMPATAEELGITDLTDPEDNIAGGVRYLKGLESYFEMVPDSAARTKFIIAAFNCGVGHVLDARRLAEKNGLDPDRWEKNVEEMVLKLSYPEYYNDPVVYYGYMRGIEPYTYVNQILERYGHYRQFIEEAAEADGDDTGRKTASTP